MFYAAQSPRGFANDITIHVFTTRTTRDAWVARHEDDGDVNSAACGAVAIRSRRARQILSDCGDAATQTYTGLRRHYPDATLEPEWIGERFGR